MSFVASGRDRGGMSFLAQVKQILVKEVVFSRFRNRNRVPIGYTIQGQGILEKMKIATYSDRRCFTNPGFVSVFKAPLFEQRLHDHTGASSLAVTAAALALSASTSDAGEKVAFRSWRTWYS